MVCTFFAVYMTMKQLLQFIENKDASSISYIQFNHSPKDKYPTYSLCLQGLSIYSFQFEKLFYALGIDSPQYVGILKGEHGTRYDYQYTSGLYKRSPLTFGNVSSLNPEYFSMNISDLLIGLDF